MNKVILLVDGSPTVHKIVELTFSDTSVRIESATTGREAVDILEHLILSYGESVLVPQARRLLDQARGGIPRI